MHKELPLGFRELSLDLGDRGSIEKPLDTLPRNLDGRPRTSEGGTLKYLIAQ